MTLPRERAIDEITDISAWMQANMHAVSTFFEREPVLRFLTRPTATAWAPAEHLDHLLRSARPLVRVLGLPRLAIRLVFGRAPQTSESYVHLHQRYLGLLQAGAGATGRYLPSTIDTTRAPEGVRRELLERWATASNDLHRALGRWSDRDLDGLALPNPILGRLSVRRMLFFTHFHNRHHLDDVSRDWQ
jgi:hypothetical protein